MGGNFLAAHFFTLPAFSALHDFLHLFFGLGLKIMNGGFLRAILLH